MNASSAHVAEYAYINPPAQREVGTIYNHAITYCISGEVNGNHLYSGRALGLTEVNDVIQLHPDLKREWPYIAAHYERIGLSFSRNIIWDSSYQLLSNYTEYQPSFFYYGGDIYDSYIDANYFNIVRFISSKNNFIRVAQNLGLPVPKTYCYEDKSYVTDTSIFSFPCYLKAAISISGSDKYRCENKIELFHALHTFSDDVPIQIQEEIKSVTSLNVKYKITDRKAERLAITEQIIEENNYKGNQYSENYDCWHVTDSYAEYLYNKGMRGLFSFNIAVKNTKEGLGYLLIGCSPRFNDSSYSSLITKKLGVVNWKQEVFTCNIKSLSQLHLSGIEYDPKFSSGVVLVNWGGVLVGKVSVLFIGNSKQQKSLRKTFIERIQ